MKQLLISFLLVNAFTYSFAQKSLGTSFFGTLKGDTKICESSSGYASATDVEALVTSILDRYGLKNGYIIMSCTQTDNCTAILDAQNRPYILFNPNFLQSVRQLNFSEADIKVNNNDWKTLTILAHELGHHLNNHLNNPRLGATKVDMELEADETAGFIVYLLGGDAYQAKLAYSDKTVNENGSYTHPPRARRLEAVQKGWEAAKKKYDKPNNITASFTFKDSFSDNTNGWFTGADQNYSIKIERNKYKFKVIPESHWYHSNRYANIDISKDFSVSVSTEWLGGVDNWGYGIEFCYDSEKKSTNIFQISSNGNYGIIKSENDIWTDLKKWTPTTAIKKGRNEKNILTVNKVGRFFFYYVNDVFLETIPANTMFGKLFGLKVSSSQSVDFDDFEITGTMLPSNSKN
ncbi:MAG: hypothetical protein K9I82_09245 [Chitinophagaceae bacterium]|nr:hypothetical protein [Chitinophagaceae bacterium]